MSKISSVRENFLKSVWTFLKMSILKNLNNFSNKKSEKSEKMNCEHNGVICIFEFSFCEHKFFEHFWEQNVIWSKMKA